MSNGEDSENTRSQSCERVLRAVNDDVNQSCTYNEQNKISNDTDESHQALAREIREKSETLIHFIESVKKSSISHQSNKKRTSDDVSVIVDKPLEREIPLHRVVEYMKKARAKKKNKINLKLSKQIKKKSESLTDYITTTARPSTESDKAKDDRNTDSQKRKQNEHNSEVPSSENRGKRYLCFFAPIEPEDYDWYQKY